MLTLQHNKLTSRSGEAILESLNENSTLKEIDLYHNKFNDPELEKRLIKSMNTQETLETFCFSGPKFSSIMQRGTAVAKEIEELFDALNGRFVEDKK